jgi:SAM-dependent methyltransferase
MKCRSCGGNTRQVFSLGKMPLANSLLDSPDQPYKTYPLDLMLCGDCSLVQLAEAVPPSEMFIDYAYLTSVSYPMVDHAKRLVDEIMDKCASANPYVVEIGSNDGYLLQHYVKRGIRVLGIDPSENAAEAAEEKGVPTHPKFFNSAEARAFGELADIIHANNVLAHVPDLNDFVSGLAILLKPGGVLIVEVPYLCRLIDRTAFDTIYHEHMYFFSLTPLIHLFARHHLSITKVEQISTHGGSLRLWIAKYGGVESSVGALLAEESAFIDSSSYYRDFAVRAERVRFDTRKLLYGRHVAGFGAAAKATIFLNACGITNAQMVYVADDTPTKQGKFIPGTGIHIVPVAEWLADQPPATMILAWNFANDIAHKYATTYHGKFFTYYFPEMIGAST